MKKIILVLLLLASTLAFGFDFASPNKSAAKFVLNPNKLTQQLFPVKLLSVNGVNTNRADAFWLKPGDYELKFSAQVDRKLTRPSMTRSWQNSKNNLSITVEAGKTYYVGFDASNRSVKEWQPVIYKVK